MTVGPIRNANGILKAPLQFRTTGNRRVTCQRALTVVNDVVVDVKACDNVEAGLEADSAATIAHQIAAKVPVR